MPLITRYVYTTRDGSIWSAMYKFYQLTLCSHYRRSYLKLQVRDWGKNNFLPAVSKLVSDVRETARYPQFS